MSGGNLRTSDPSKCVYLWRRPMARENLELLTVEQLDCDCDCDELGCC